jgi:hypothetical protein
MYAWQNISCHRNKTGMDQGTFDAIVEASGMSRKEFLASNPDFVKMYASKRAPQATMYDLPVFVEPRANRGGGDCMYLAIAEALRTTSQEIREITSLGFRDFFDSIEVDWSTFKALLSDEDQRSMMRIGNVQAEMKWYEQEIRKPGRIWGDNIYLMMFLKYAYNRFTEFTDINILIIDRLANAKSSIWASPLCLSSNRHQKCFWIILVRTRENQGRGALHYELGEIYIEQRRTKYPFTYTTPQILAALQTLPEYKEIVMEVSDCRETFARCMNLYNSGLMQ